MQVTRAAAAVDELQLFGLEERERLLAEALLQRRLDVVDDTMKEHILARLRLRERDTRVQAREDVHPVAAAILVAVEAFERAAHRDRHEEVGLVAEGRALEPCGRDADDAEDLAVH